MVFGFVVMIIDKSWISKPRNTIEYANSLNEILKFSFGHVDGVFIKCPCSKFGFKKWKTRDIVQEHLTCTTFPQNYQTLYMHGEGASGNEFVIVTSVRVIEDFIESHNSMETC